MSVTITTTKNLLNSSAVNSIGIDVITRDAYYTTSVGYQAGTANMGNYNCFFGWNAANRNNRGAFNIYFGAFCAPNATTNREFCR